jgi:beta-lactamase class A
MRPALAVLIVALSSATLCMASSAVAGPGARSAGTGLRGPRGCTLRRLTPRLRALCRQLEQLAKQDPSTFAVGFVDLRDNQQLYLRPDAWMHAASTYKTAVMVAVFDAIARGKLRLDTPIKIVNRFRSIVDGSSYRMPVPRRPRDLPPRMIGKSLPVSTLVEEMITISSNLATNLLLERVGAKQAMKTLRRLKLRGIKVLRGVQDIKAFDRGLSNEVTARGMTRLYAQLARGKLISTKASQQMIAVLLRQRLHAKLPPLLPRSIKLAHKGGTISTVSHDGGIALRKGRAEYVVVVMSRGYKRLKQVDKVLARISRAIWLHVARKRGWRLRRPKRARRKSR